MNTRIKKAFALVSAICLVVTCSVVPAFAQDDKSAFTRGEARNMILKYCDNYNSSASGESVLKGYGTGDALENNAVTRVEALAMLARAFSPLAAPDTYWSNVSHTDVAFSDVPDWAKDDIAKLISAGILTKSADGLLKSNETISSDELKTYIYRIFAAYGTNSKDDYFSTSNRSYLNSAVSYPGYILTGVAADADHNNHLRINKIVSDAVKNDSSKDSSAYQIKAIYKTFSDYDGQEAQGVTPIKPWLDAIDNAKSIADLNAVYRDIAAQSGFTPLYGFSTTTDINDSNKYVLCFGANNSKYGIDFYQNGDASKQEAYRNYIASVLELAGYSKEQAASDAQIYYNYESELSKKELSAQDKYDPLKTNTSITFNDLKEKLPALDLSALLKAEGFNEKSNLILDDTGTIDELASVMTDSSLEIAKTVSRVCVLNDFTPYLGYRFYQLSLQFKKVLYGKLDEPSKEDRAIFFISDNLSDNIGRLYTDAYFSEKTKTDITNMVSDLIGIYKKRIASLDWMSEATKAEAIKKLDTMKVNVGVPDKWSDAYDGLVLKTPEEGGTLFSNMCILMKANIADIASKLEKPVDKGILDVPTQEVNAFYDPSCNGIFILAGILQAPLYDENASEAANLGSIGITIGHELTHAFDNNGSQYDENGNLNDWWTAADKEEFEKRCQAVVDYYDGWEAYPGVAAKGDTCISENIADIGGMSSALELLKQREANPDYKTFFESYAKAWAEYYSPDAGKQIFATDVHAPQNLRVNRVVSNTDEFNEFYKLNESDGMYTAPEKRIKLW